jgi:hypothetical protein
MRGQQSATPRVCCGMRSIHGGVVQFYGEFIHEIPTVAVLQPSP